MKSVTVNDQNILLCPVCSGEYLHHFALHSIFRFEEDGDGLVSLLQRGSSFTRCMAGAELPGRRDGASVDFYCESCHGTDDACRTDNPHTLQITQDKGRTTLAWLEESE